MHSGQDEEPTAILRAWGLAEHASRGPRARVTLTDIARAACDVADDRGFDAATLAAVADTLDLATTALYRHVDSKDTLTELMIDHALGPCPDSDLDDARAAFDDWVDALWGRYRAHPWMATYPLRRAPRCPNAFAWLDVLVGALRRLGERDPLGTAVAVDVLVRGYAGLDVAAADSRLGESLVAEIGRRHRNLVPGPDGLASPRAQLTAALSALLR